MNHEQAKEVIELLKRQIELLEAIAIAFAAHANWQRESADYPRQVEVVGRKT